MRPCTLFGLPSQLCSRLNLLELSISALDELKGRDIVHIDVSGLTDVTDVMILVTGNTNRQVRALADNLIASVKQADHIILGVEGYEDGEWALIDLADVVVHVMIPAAREFYELEKLWTVNSSSRGQIET